ncbi:hypothetical protein [Leucobacter japonicus]|uniref:hypothetical protein n=1 Tax=Leucobacter japonicus TaxID=1461259 RepID=UPI0012E1E7A0|nr:hypothetical protein [Leucobacter japonicus]
MHLVVVESISPFEPFAPLIAGGIGALSALFGVWLTSTLQQRRENRAAQGEALVGAIRAWGDAYKLHIEEPAGLSRVQVDSAVAAAKLVAVASKRDAKGIEKIANATTNSLGSESTGRMIGTAQEALMGWFVRGHSGSRAFAEFQEIGKRNGLDL